MLFSSDKRFKDYNSENEYDEYDDDKGKNDSSFSDFLPTYYIPSYFENSKCLKNKEKKRMIEHFKDK